MPSCDCTWAESTCGPSDGSRCWHECCGPDGYARKAHPRPTPVHSVCLFLLRWGEWPPWSSLLLHSMERNPTMRFLLVGDQAPMAARWPNNCHFHRFSLHAVLERVRSSLGIAPARMSVAGGASKISDLKPMLAHLFPEMLGGCAFWGWLQEDQVLGDLRTFLDPSTLDSHDIISPLAAPLYHAGPFMLYRHVPKMDALYRRSSQWRMVVADSNYLAFVRRPDHSPPPRPLPACPSLPPQQLHLRIRLRAPVSCEPISYTRPCRVRPSVACPNRRTSGGDRS